MKIIKRCEICGAEQLDYMGGSHYIYSHPNSCQLLRPVEEYYTDYYLTYQLRYLKATNTT